MRSNYYDAICFAKFGPKILTQNGSFLTSFSLSKKYPKTTGQILTKIHQSETVTQRKKEGYILQKKFSKL